MIILKTGKKNQTKQIRGLCDRCGCEFTFTEKEAKRFNDPRHDGDGWEVKCPQCKTTFIEFDK